MKSKRKRGPQINPDAVRRAKMVGMRLRQNVLEDLKERASLTGRSLSGEAAAIIEQSLSWDHVARQIRSIVREEIERGGRNT